jgi:hypothetical protein
LAQFCYQRRLARTVIPRAPEQEETGPAPGYPEADILSEIQYRARLATVKATGDYSDSVPVDSIFLQDAVPEIGAMDMDSAMDMDG